MSDIEIRQGTDGGRTWPILNSDGTPFSLVGYTVKAQIRSYTGTLLHEFSSTVGNALISNNTVSLIWTHAQTTAWRWSNGRYDLEITSPTGSVIQVDKGAVTLIKEETR